MKTLFLIFITLHGHPITPTSAMVPLTTSCRSEIDFIKGWNQAQAKAKSGLWAYASCEPATIK